MNILKQFPKKVNCFLSHCSDDRNIMDKLTDLLYEICNDKYINIFNTYNEDNSTLAGESISDRLRKELRNANLMIIPLTDNYIRSIVCIAELSTFWYSQKNIIPILFSKNAKKFLKDLYGENIIYIDVVNVKTNLDYQKCGIKLVSSLEKNGVKLRFKKEDAIEKSAHFFSQIQQEHPSRPYIGCSIENKKLIDYCELYGINMMKNSVLPTSEIIEKLSNRKEIYIISTTGSNMINSLTSEFLCNAIRSGTNLTVLIPNKDSDFCNDVAEIESPDDKIKNQSRLSNEFDNVVANLRKTVNEVQAIHEGHNVGHIFLGCTYTLLRQTIILGIDENNIWGWVSMTLPPKKTSDGTPSFEVSGKRTEKSLAKLLYDHILSIKQIAIRRNAFFELKKDADFDKFN